MKIPRSFAAVNTVDDILSNMYCIRSAIEKAVVKLVGYSAKSDQNYGLSDNRMPTAKLFKWCSEDQKTQTAVAGVWALDGT